MNIKETVDSIVQKPMDRREFLWHVGAAGLAVVGVSGVLKALNDRQSSGRRASSSYGGSAYGGGAEGGSSRNRI
jgi:hypothetical protein